jgi:hypothetical protein
MTSGGGFMNNTDLKGVLIYKKDKIELDKAKRDIE